MTIVSANAQVIMEQIIIETTILLVVMVINLVAQMSVEGDAKYTSVEALEVANRILALLLAALAMETIVNGFGEIFQGYM